MSVLETGEHETGQVTAIRTTLKLLSAHGDQIKIYMEVSDDKVLHVHCTIKTNELPSIRRS